MADGVFISKGMKVGILDGDLTITTNEEGQFHMDAILSTAFNVVPYWLRIASDNLTQSRTAFLKLKDEWGEDSETQHDLLISEFLPSMQVIVACATAFDALYGMLKPFAKISDQTLASWKTNKTSRAAQIAEVIRQTHRLKPARSNEFRQAIKAIFKTRDEAVHPSNKLRRTALRPELGVGVDWNFATYRYENAKLSFENTIKIVVFLHENPAGNKDANSVLKSIVDDMLALQIVELKTNDEDV